MAISPLNSSVFSVDCPNGNLHSYFPMDLLRLVLTGLPKFIDFCSFTATCSNLRIIYSDDTLCQMLFQKHFPDFPRLVPMQNWLSECQMQQRCIQNSNNGVYLSRTFEIKECDYEGGEIYSFALDEGGNILLGCRDGSLKCYNPSTIECKEVIPACSSTLGKLVYERGLCAAKFHDNTVRIWDLSDLNAPQEIQVPRGDATLSSEVMNCINLIDGQLLVSNEDGIIQVWDPRSKEPPITFKSHIGLPCELALCDTTLFSNSVENGQVAVWDLESGECVKTLNCDILPVSFIQFQKTVFATKQCYPTTDICVWDLKGVSPIPLVCNEQQRWTSLESLAGVHSDDCFVSNAQRSFYLARRTESSPSKYEKCKKINLSGSDHFITAGLVQGVFIYPGPIFSHGGLFFNACKTETVQTEAIFCIDFIASDEDILSELVQKLKSQDPDQQKEGIRRLHLMPSYVRDRVYEEAALAASAFSPESLAQGIENYLAKQTASKPSEK